MSKKGKMTGQEQTHTESHNADSHEFENHTADSLQTAGHDAKSSSSAYSQEGYKFVVANGFVTSVTEVEHGLTETKSIKPYETLDANMQSSVRNGLETEAIKGPAIHWESRDGNGDAIHAEVAHGTDPIATLTGLATDAVAMDYWF